MARKKSEIPLATRMRENQRRSRARKKEYLEDLKKKLNDFESRGVHASVEMQTAAKRIHEENHLLRKLLTMKGVSTDEINHFLRENGARPAAASECSPHPHTSGLSPSQLSSSTPATTPDAPSPDCHSGQPQSPYYLEPQIEPLHGQHPVSPNPSPATVRSVILPEPIPTRCGPRKDAQDGCSPMPDSSSCRNALMVERLLPRISKMPDPAPCRNMQLPEPNIRSVPYSQPQSSVGCSGIQIKAETKPETEEHRPEPVLWPTCTPHQPPAHRPSPYQQQQHCPTVQQQMRHGQGPPSQAQKPPLQHQPVQQYPPQPPPTPCQPSNQSKEVDSGDYHTTDCTEAAQIIAGMRMHGDHQQALQAIGCSNPTANCRVKSAFLLEVMDMS